jgi:hypothetical protein
VLDEQDTAMFADVACSETHTKTPPPSPTTPPTLPATLPTAIRDARASAAACAATSDFRQHSGADGGGGGGVGGGAAGSDPGAGTSAGGRAGGSGGGAGGVGISGDGGGVEGLQGRILRVGWGIRPQRSCPQDLQRRVGGGVGTRPVLGDCCDRFGLGAVILEMVTGRVVEAGRRHEPYAASPHLAPGGAAYDVHAPGTISPHAACVCVCILCACTRGYIQCQ